MRADHGDSALCADGFRSLFRTADGAWLGAFRVLFGVAMCVSMMRFLAYGWVERFFVEPSMHFKYWGFAWVEPLGASEMTVLFWSMVGLAACVAAGLLFRVTATLFALGLAYVQLIDVSTYLNHYYLALLLAVLLAASPAGRVWSLDGWIRRRLRSSGVQASSESGARVAVFWLYLLRFQVGCVYVFAGLAKLNADWLIHAQPLRIWLGTQTHLPVIGPLFTVEGVPLLMSWAGFLFDTTIVLWLSWRRTRAVAYLAVLVFHTMTGVLFPIGMFPFIMSLAATVFFDPGWPRALGARLGVLRERVASVRDAISPPHALGLRHQALLAAAALYCLVQVGLPLRFLAYGGNVMWHEQGMRFAWRVMLRAKGGGATFFVKDGRSEREAVVHPRQYLTDLQQAEMVSQPDLILQMAHHIREDYEKRGWQDVQVRVDSRASLNGRRSALLVLPSVNLATRADGIARADWIARAPSEPPHSTRPVL